MRLSLVSFVSLLFLVVRQAQAVEPLQLKPAEIIDPHSTASKKSDLRYYGQPAEDGTIDLTATNGFFDRCFEATEPTPARDKNPFIGTEFRSLQRISDEAAGTARWHLWCANAGEIHVKIWLSVPASEANHEWTIRAGEETQTLRAAASDGQTAQPQTLIFKVKPAGRVTIAIDCTKTPPPAKSKFHFMRLTGSAIDGAQLLRTRWRPAAVHARFSAPPECPEPRLWVFETRSVSKTSSYSPLTTGFGYFGTSFNQDGRIAPGAGFNFSMWAASRNENEAPPLEKMPRLIGTDLAAATFSTFGHEGTGVKFRDAVAYPDGAERTIQALRVEPTSEGLITYYGYYFDEQAARWRLYASAQAPAKNPRAAKNLDQLVLSSTGSFCEIPGPPNRERSGDIVREIKRRGWFYGNDGKWYRATLGNGEGPNEEKPARAEVDSDDSTLTNKRNAYMENYAVDGWISMATGGIEYHLNSAAAQKPPALPQPAAQPDYLNGAHTKELFALPVEFGASTAKTLTANAATIEYELKATGPNSLGTLYYGTVDCVTYPPKQIKNGSAVELAMAQPDRTWQAALPAQKVTAAANQFQLSGLNPHTTYYYRLYVEHDAGKSWDYRSGSFTTK